MYLSIPVKKKGVSVLFQVSRLAIAETPGGFNILPLGISLHSRPEHISQIFKTILHHHQSLQSSQGPGL